MPAVVSAGIPLGEDALLIENKIAFDAGHSAVEFYFADVVVDQGRRRCHFHHYCRIQQRDLFLVFKARFAADHADIGIDVLGGVDPDAHLTSVNLTVTFVQSGAKRHNSCGN